MASSVRVGEEADSFHDEIDNGHVSGTLILIIGMAFLLNMLDGFDVTAMAFTVHSSG